jgi:hypothetical protein
MNSSAVRGGSQNTVCTTSSAAGLALSSFNPPNHRYTMVMAQRSR